MPLGDGPAGPEEPCRCSKETQARWFIPCVFLTVAPPGGILELRGMKEEIYNLVRQRYLPYTFITVGWWDQLAWPAVPSEKVDCAIPCSVAIVGDGNVPRALTALRDIGKYVAEIITDDRTLNKLVLAYDTVTTQNEIWDIMEKLTSEKVERQYVTESNILEQVKDIRQSIAASGKSDFATRSMRWIAEYQYAWGIRGNNNPEYAKYLG